MNILIMESGFRKPKPQDCQPVNPLTIMAQKRFTINITTRSKVTGIDTIIEMDVVVTKALSLEGNNFVQMSEHDLAARMFALEFAVNNHSELPMRVHINEVED